MTVQKLSVLTFSCILTSLLFDLTLFSFRADISLVALPLGLLFTVALYFSARAVFGKKNAARLSVLRELLQYGSYVLLVAFVLRRSGSLGTPFFVDALSVLFWLVSSALELVILHYIHPKRAGALHAGWGQALLPKKRAGIFRLLFEAVSWVDALVQAVFMVLLLNVFIVQLYEIPSESMVPEFLIKDRVIVFKTASGPRFPLSTIGLPYLKRYKRGDIVVFRNPHYVSDRQSEVRTFVSQIVYMLTLTTVNLNVDEHGEPKADPLVKRVVGLPGEQLMMQDGILYARSKDRPDWQVVEEDSQYAAWNLHEVPNPAVKAGIRQFPLGEEEYESMLKVEAERNALDLLEAARDCRELARRFSVAYKSIGAEQSGSSFTLGERDSLIYSLFSNVGQLTSKLLQAPNGDVWFSDFLQSWTLAADGKTAAVLPLDFQGDLYAEANFRLNVLIKRTFARLVVRNAELLLARPAPSAWNNDEELKSALSEAEALYMYTVLLDRRNMPVFPANAEDGSPSYIPAGAYFMMGDNRFNSLDMRHSYEEWIAPLTKFDAQSVTYRTNMQPQYVDKSRMLGTTSYRFWPSGRMGVPGHTGFAR